MPARKKSAYKNEINPTPGRPKWKPTYEQRIKAYNLWVDHASDLAIARELNISRTAYLQNKNQLEAFFNRRFSRLNKKKVGRPDGSMLDNHPLCNANTLRGFAIAGYSMSQVAKLIGCSQPTLSLWLSRRPSLKEIFVNAADRADMQVINALLRRAKGMKQKKIKFASYKGALTDKEVYYEDLAPDPTAATVWLVNRKKWSRDSEGSRDDNRGKILEALDMMTEIEEEELKQFDGDMKGR